MNQRWIEDVLRGRRGGVPAAVVRGLLAPAGVLYGGVMGVRRRVYEGGIFATHALGLPAISVGNLSVGGTGKSPFVRWLCQGLIERGERPLVLARGYGARAGQAGLDDEGEALRRACPDLVVRQGRDRVAAAREALGQHPELSVAVLDDAAQTLRLRRDVDVWLVDALRPFDSGWPLPAGGLREGRAALRAASICVVTRWGRATPEQQARTLARLRRFLRTTVPLLRASHVPGRVWRMGGGVMGEAPRRVWLCSGIADPSSFERGAAAAGFEVAGSSHFGDHHAYKKSEVRAVVQAARAAAAEAVLLTGKDEAKIQALMDPAHDLPFLVTEPELRFEAADEALLWSHLDQELARVREARR